eukprot:snap_masked-scaffold_1-processed-gene-2.32-mRNA-1 protein AED:1.00 eAED:1.00 QI:0/-1/0/0/-1/1/1/0/524
MWTVKRKHPNGFLSNYQRDSVSLPPELIQLEKIVKKLADKTQLQAIKTEKETILPDKVNSFAFPEIAEDISNLNLYVFRMHPINIEMNLSGVELKGKDLVYVILSEEKQIEATFVLFTLLAGFFKLSIKNLNIFVDEKTNLSDIIDLPEHIYLPLIFLSKLVDRPPVFDYSACVLNNWSLIDKTKSISLENIKIHKTFTNLSSEEWFYKIHVVIEAYGGSAVEKILQIEHYLSKEEDFLTCLENLEDDLNFISGAINLMKHTFSRMNEKCRDSAFYNKIRPWLSGFKDREVLYGGASGAQSSLLPFLDAFFGVPYLNSNKQTKETEKFIKNIKRFRSHMPKIHRELVSKYETNANLQIRNFFSKVENYEVQVENPQSGSWIKPLFFEERARAEKSEVEIKLLVAKISYNRCIQSMLQFRRMHLGFSTMFITRQAKKTEQKQKIKEAEKGTGGTTFSKHFMEHIDATRSCLYKVEDSGKEIDLDCEEVLKQVSQNKSGFYSFNVFEQITDQIEKAKQFIQSIDYE